MSVGGGGMSEDLKKSFVMLSVPWKFWRQVFSLIS